MTGDQFVGHFSGARKTGDRRWLCRCSGSLHQRGDKHPSLSVRELDDGRLLVHCFSGCTTSDVVASVGLAMWDLYPKAADYHRPAERRPFPAMDILKAVAQEALIAATAASNLARGMLLSDADRERLSTAAARLDNAYDIASGRSWDIARRTADLKETA